MKSAREANQLALSKCVIFRIKAKGGKTKSDHEPIGYRESLVREVFINDSRVQVLSIHEADGCLHAPSTCAEEPGSVRKSTETRRTACCIICIDQQRSPVKGWKTSRYNASLGAKEEARDLTALHQCLPSANSSKLSIDPLTS